MAGLSADRITEWEGGSLNELVAMPSAMAAKDLAFFGQQVFGRLEKMSKPSIAMINARLFRELESRPASRNIHPAQTDA